MLGIAVNNWRAVSSRSLRFDCSTRSARRNVPSAASGVRPCRLRSSTYAAMASSGRPCRCRMLPSRRCALGADGLDGLAARPALRSATAWSNSFASAFARAILIDSASGSLAAAGGAAGDVAAGGAAAVAAGAGVPDAARRESSSGRRRSERPERQARGRWRRRLRRDRRRVCRNGSRRPLHGASVGGTTGAVRLRRSVPRLKEQPRCRHQRNDSEETDQKSRGADARARWRGRDLAALR